MFFLYTFYQDSLHLDAMNYHLDLLLEKEVKQDEVKAKFSKTKRQLTVTLPIAYQ